MARGGSYKKTVRVKGHSRGARGPKPGPRVRVPRYARKRPRKDSYPR